MKRLIVSIWLLLFAIPAVAQPIHNHPQKVAYNSPTEYPWASCQTHWAPGEDVNPPGSVTPFMAHTHIEPQPGFGWPLYAELSQPFTLKLQVVLFHTDGYIDVVGPIMGLPPHIIWDDTGTAQQPIMNGDPNGVRTWKFTATFDPHEGAEGRDLPRPHGWWFITVFARTIYNRPTSIPGFHTSIGQAVIIPYWSMIDPTQPETGIGDGIGEIRCNGGVNSDDPGGPSIFGSNSSVIRRQDAPLLAPFKDLWPSDIASYGYGIAAGFPTGFYKVFVDPDLHNGNAGTVIRSVERLFNFEDYSGYDPAVIGLGKHRLAIDWVQSGDGAPQLFNPGETLVSRLVVEVEVTNDPNAIPPPPFELPPPPPPPSCAPPKIVVGGQCVDPPPIESRRSVGDILQLFLGEIPQPRFFICPTSQPCVELVIRQN